MGFSFRINFVDVICDDSLTHLYADGERIGFEFDVRLSYYRGLFLSCVDSFGLEVDGERYSNDNITFSINGKSFGVNQLNLFASEFWDLLQSARITVLKKGGLAQGEHALKLELMLRVPYLPLPGSDGGHSYMPLDSCGEKTLAVR